jgi:hypothetical protein
MKNIYKEIFEKNNIIDFSIIDSVSIILSTDKAIETYTDYYNLQNLLNKEVYMGYDEVIESLKNTKEREVRLSLFELKDNKRFIFFTNIDETHILGYLVMSLLD